jgi:hypothetical protein
MPVAVWVHRVHLVAQPVPATLIVWPSRTRVDDTVKVIPGRGGRDMAVVGDARPVDDGTSRTGVARVEVGTGRMAAGEVVGTAGAGWVPRLAVDTAPTTRVAARTTAAATASRPIASGTTPRACRPWRPFTTTSEAWGRFPRTGRWPAGSLNDTMPDVTGAKPLDNRVPR